MKTMTELVSWFQTEYPELVASMRACSHHGESLNPYHVEGDIFCHTMMVCKQAENASYPVKIAALLHDIGKPSTRAMNPKNGNVSFYNHDAVSAFMSLEILKRPELGLTKEQQVRIFNLIALHTQIYKLSVEQLAAIGDKELVSDLIELGKADHAGRFHTKGDAVIPTIQEIPFKSQYKEASMISKNKDVTILVGLPASGKSTWVKQQNGFVVSRDSVLMVEALNCKALGMNFTYEQAWNHVDQNKVNNGLEKLFQQSKKRDKVVVDMTHMSKKSRRRTLSHFDNSYKKKAVVFLTDLETLFLQNSKRSGKVIDEAVIQKMIRSFYPPTLEEFDEIEHVINGV